MTKRIESIINRLKYPTYENYHIHSSLSNITTPDSAVLKKHFAERALELGHKTLSSCEHGSAVMFIESYDIAKDKGLKFIYCVESYFVPDRTVNDDTNSHIILIARNHEGLRELNEIISESQEAHSFYYKPRVDWELLETLNPENVMITTACVGGLISEHCDADENVRRLKEMFPHFYIEMHPHWSKLQKEHNVKAIELAKKYNVPMIAGCDSHYIYDYQHEDREAFKLSKGVKYPDEDGWFMDYPDIETLVYRFVEQGIMTDEQIIESIDNTNLLLDFDDIYFDKEIKVPTMFPELTQEQKDKKLRDIVYGNYNDYKNKFPEIVTPKEEEYMREIEKELKVIEDTKFADYFLLNYYIVKRAEELGGCLTATGRGSAPGFLLCRFLGFTTIDRIQESIPLLSERFATAERINETKSLFDIDMNMADPAPFIQATREFIGEHGCYYMCALGEYKEKSAFKMYARAKNIKYELANVVVKKLDEYDEAVDSWNKYEKIDEDDECPIKISDYITDPEHVKVLDESKKYMGIYDNIKAHACGNLVFSGNIRREFGLTRTRKGLLVANISGKMADKYKYLKNDYLIVSVVDIIDRVFKKAGISNWKEEYPATRIKQIVSEDTEIMQKVYWEGNVVCINQVEQRASSESVKKYKPNNIEELAQFTAAVRPGFKSNFNKFLCRESNEYGVEIFDHILRKDYSTSSWVLFQENAMEAMQLAGIPMKECYEVIKAISKKNEDVIMKYKDKFIEGFSKKIYMESNKEHNF
ncbi:MAG: PHP domain-containing protein [Bacteroidales bacterium]